MKFQRFVSEFHFSDKPRICVYATIVYVSHAPLLLPMCSPAVHFCFRISLAVLDSLIERIPPLPRQWQFLAEVQYGDVFVLCVA